jgi:hypothetical protein
MQRIILNTASSAAIFDTPMAGFFPRYIDVVNTEDLKRWAIYFNSTKVADGESYPGDQTLSHYTNMISLFGQDYTVHVVANTDRLLPVEFSDLEILCDELTDEDLDRLFGPVPADHPDPTVYY